MAKKIGTMLLNLLAGLVITIALIDVATTRIFGFSLLAWVSFGNGIVEKVLAGFVGIVGLVGVILLLFQGFKKVRR